MTTEPAGWARYVADNAADLDALLDAYTELLATRQRIASLIDGASVDPVGIVPQRQTGHHSASVGKAHPIEAKSVNHDAADPRLGATCAAQRSPLPNPDER